MNKIYHNVIGGIGDSLPFRQDWRWLTLYGCVIYFLVLALRLSFAGRWDHPELWVAGERIMATHDAYFWLAKAKGVGLLNGYPLAMFTRYLHDAFGFTYGAIGFWMPAVMGALVAVACFLWGALIAGRNGGIFAGLIGGMTPGFFYRSRLGYFDTDMFTLLMPLIVTALLAIWVGQHIRGKWFVSESDANWQKPALWVAFVFGLITRVGVMWHEDILNVTIMYWFMAVIVLLAVGIKGRRTNGLYGLVIIALIAFPGESHGRIPLMPFSWIHLPVSYYLSVFLWGVILAAAIIVLVEGAQRKKPEWANNLWLALGVLALVILSTSLGQLSIVGSLTKLAGYFFPKGTTPVVQETAALGPIYPSIVQSIIEAKLVPLGEILTRGAFFPWLGYLSLISAVCVMILRPAAIFLLPLLVLHLVSVRLGVRFSMFGGAPLMIFLGVGLYWVTLAVMNGFARKKVVAFGVQVLLGLSLMGYLFNAYGKLPLTPVFHKGHAEALIELGKIARKDGMIWTWWDWGYASQYYAGLETVIDGGKHAGRDIYPVAFALATSSPEKANRMIAFSAQYSTPGPLATGLAPALQWDAIPRSELSDALDKELARSDYPPAPPQYLVVSWKDMSISKWITYFGNWNLQTGETVQASAGSYNPGQLGINVQRGAVMNRQGGGGLVKDITVLDRNGVQFQNYFMNAMSPQLLPKRQHLIINKVTRQSVLFDRVAYTSLMRRLLMDDPTDPELSKYFRLVVDKLPFARVYEVLQ